MIVWLLLFHPVETPRVYGALSFGTLGIYRKSYISGAVYEVGSIYVQRLQHWGCASKLGMRNDA